MSNNQSTAVHTFTRQLLSEDENCWQDISHLLILETSHSDRDSSFSFKTHELCFICIQMYYEGQCLQLFAQGYAVEIQLGQVYLQKALNHLHSPCLL